MSLNSDPAHTKVFSRRAFLLAGIQGGILGILAGRLAWLQIAQGSKYKTLSEKNRINFKLLAPTRGQILDRNGIPLAINDQSFRALIIPEQAKDMKQALKRLRQYIDLSDKDVAHILDLASKQAKFVPVEVKDDLSWPEVSKIEVRSPEFSGLSIDVGEIRRYPMGLSTAHIIGYVSSVNSKELDRGDPVLKLPGFKTGKTGIEKSFENELRGRAGTAQVEVNAAGRPVRELKNNVSLQGSNITLTIDSRLQNFVQARLSAYQSASAVVLDAKTGAVYALCSHPSFDPNVFIKGLSSQAWEDLLSNPAYPLTNKAIAGLYPPGSTFKMITVLAALEAGIINSKTRSYCPGHYEYGKDRFHCWKSSGHGWVDLRQALSQSCDIYFYELATKLGINPIARMAERFGMGQKFNFDIQGERAGLVPDKSWKLKSIGRKWQPGETIVASIGQGYIQATPLQLAVMMARLVNGGVAIKPWMTAYIGDQFKGYLSWPKINVQKTQLDMIHKGMEDAVNDKNGTAYQSRIIDAGMQMGGKTGTAQVKRITMAQRLAGIKNEDLPWKSRHHALFTGYAPLHDPRYVVSIVIEHGGSGGSVAAPLAKDILLETQRLNPSKSNIQMTGT